MAKVLVEEQNLSDIATSIRSKNGTETTYKPGQMATAISAIDTVNNQNKTVSSDGTYTADSGYTGLGEVVVSTGAAGYKQTATNWGNAIARMSYYLAGNWGEPEPHTYTYEELLQLAPIASQTVTEGITDVQTAKYKLNQIITALRQLNINPSYVPQLQGDRIQKFADAIIEQVNPSTRLEAKQVTVSQSGTTTVTPTSGKYGLSSVEVTASFTPDTETKTVNISTNGVTTVNKSANKDGMTSVEINTSVQPDLETLTDTITTNGTTTYTPTVGKDGFDSVTITTNVSGGASEYFETTPSQNNGQVLSIVKKIPPLDFRNRTSASGFFQNTSIIEIGSIENFGNVTSMYYMCNECIKLTEAPTIDDTSKVTNMQWCFNNCYRLQKVPYYNTEKVTTFQLCFSTCTDLRDVDTFNFASVTASNALQSMFYGCNNLTDASLNNILASCVTAVNYTGTKTLNQLGISSTYYYPASRIEALSNYQSFLDAGWTIGH